MQLKERYFLLHNFQTSSHQIDTIFLCEKFLLIVEIKNIAGRIDFNETCHQFTRTLEDGSMQGFRNPLDQVRRHQRMLQQLTPTLPVIYVIVLAHPKTIIGHLPQSEPIIHSSGLEFYIRKLLSTYKPQCTSEELHNLLDKLIQMQVRTKPQFNLIQHCFCIESKCFLCESEAAATERQIQKSPTVISGGMNARKVMESEGVPNSLLNQVKPPADVRDFEMSQLCKHNSKSRRNYAKA
ncbi:nuclease-related domain-containing protein [Metasolibacillus meyeri]|uniref:Nuclease-related domain-containing protein n=1 Tax=Metasolibacillus meyeri TaxID=1071052 RepID=A0AAW9NW78_9BACL|nr:nuclease-related domain-containing protein [Metasolibacillus meyeri]MEC1179223.1 nuclease-related domain-containing protein [Metasolibacillus meyeri]